MTSHKFVILFMLIWGMIMIPFLGGRIGWILGISIAVLFCAEILYYIFLPIAIPCELDLPHYGDKRKKYTGTFQLSQDGIWPIFSGRAYGIVRNIPMEEEREFSFRLALLGHEEGIAGFDIYPEYCGAVQIEIRKIEIYSLFGFAKKTRELQLKKETVIYPQTKEVHIIMPAYSNLEGEEERIEASIHGYDPGYYDGIRPYRDGDSLKNIHWNLTGKNDDFMVKELGIPTRILPMLFLETTMKHKNSKMTDGLLEAYAAISAGLIEAGIEHVLVFRRNKKEGFCFHRISGVEQLEELMDALLHTLFYSEERLSVFELPEKCFLDYSSMIYMGNINVLKATEELFSQMEMLTTWILETDEKGRKNEENKYFFNPSTMQGDLREIIIQ